MFYPLDLWLTSPLKEYIGKKSQQLQRQLEHKDTIFWHARFYILQNINDKMTKRIETGQGSSFLTTKNKKPDTKSQQEKWEEENNKTDILQMGLHSR